LRGARAESLPGEELDPGERGVDVVVEKATLNSVIPTLS
jgi:hypothetical protein